jgi:MFS family permease
MAEPVRRPGRKMKVTGWLLILLGIAPVLGPVISGTIANWNGCELSEAAISACEVMGFNAGPALYTLFVMGWLALVSLPLALLGIVLLMLAGGRRWRHRRSTAKREREALQNQPVGQAASTASPGNPKVT